MTAHQACGVRILGSGSAVPPRRLTNADLEKIMDTSDEWIVQRTGIKERRVVDQQSEGTYTLSRDALQRAIDDAGISGDDIDLVIVGTVTGEMTCPSVACRVADAVGAAPCGAFDVTAACCGFVYSLNIADSLIRSGRHGTVAVIGCDAMSTVCDYSDRSVSILFGDAAGAVILKRDDDPGRGCLYQTMDADGSYWPSLYMPRRAQEVPEGDDSPIALGCLRMNGREIYKFAVGKLCTMIRRALDQTGMDVGQISQVICHQSNIRIIEAARDRLGLPPEKVYINIDRYGNSSAGSVGLCFDQLRRAGKVQEGDNVLFAAIGGGLTWATCLWRL